MRDRNIEEIQKEALPAKVFVGDEVYPNLWDDGKYLYDVWNNKRGDRLAPQRKDLSPYDMKSCLPLIAIHNVEYTPLRMQVRLIGTHVVEATGMEATGKYMDELPNTESVIDRAKWIIVNCEPMACIGLPLLWSPFDYKHYDVLSMPLIDDNSDVAMILYLSRYY